MTIKHWLLHFLPSKKPKPILPAYPIDEITITSAKIFYEELHKPKGPKP